MSNLYADFISHCGELLNAGKHQECQMLLDGYLSNRLDDPIALYLLGSSLSFEAKYGQAMLLLKRSLELDPSFDPAWHNLGVAYKSVERSDDAKAAYEKALEINPDRQDTMAMMAGIYVNAGDPKPGIEWARKSIAIDPNSSFAPHAVNHLAHCLLEDSQWEEGWKAYKKRWNVPQRAKEARDYGGVPIWTGEKVKRLVIHGEQGLGDEILFLTCLPTDLCEELVIECAKRLVPTIKRSFPMAEVYGSHDEVMQHPKPDAWLSMGDLPGMFPVINKPVIKADPERVKFWREKMEAEGSGPYILVAWEGGLRSTHRSQRNAPLSLWKPLLKHGTPISVQYTRHATEQAKELGIPHWQEAITDIDEQMALISACDLLVSVNQSAIHFAGGLGKKVLCLTPKAHAWRYTSDTDFMHWYSDVRIIKQPIIGEWEPVFAEAEKQIADFCGIPRAKQTAA